MKAIKHILWIWIILLSSEAISYTQDFLMPYTGDTVITTCTGMIYDNGGPNGNYTNNADGMITLIPDSPDKKIQLTFNYLNLDNTGDSLHIFNGTDPSMPMVGSYNYLLDTFVYSSNPSGALTLKLVSDGAGNNEGFNASISCFSDTFQTDLLINNVTLTSESLAPGLIIGINTLYSNTGYLMIQNVIFSYYLSTDSVLDASDQLFYSYSLDYMGHASEYLLQVSTSIPTNATPGNQYIIAKIDNADQIDETNESNNIFYLPVFIQNTVKDIAISYVNFSNNLNFSAGSSISIYIDVANLGQTKIDTFYTGFYLSVDTLLDNSDILLLSKLSANLYSGGYKYISSNFTLPEDLPVGTYYLIIHTDNQNIIDELNEANNYKIFYFNIEPKQADLSIQEYYSNNAEILYKNINNSLRYYIYNTGNYIIKDLYTGFYLSKDEILDSTDKLIYTHHSNDIYNSSNYCSVNLQFNNPDSVPDGLYFLISKVDSPDSIQENDETNNLLFQPVLVTSYEADINFTGIKPLSTTIAYGQYFAVSCNYTNNSAITINSFYTNFYLSKDTILNIPNDSLPNILDDIPLGKDYVYSINPYSSITDNYSLYFYDTIPYGNYYLFAVADPTHSIDLVNTANNVIYTPVNVGEAKFDLNLIGIDIPLKTLRTSNSFNISTLIKNMGNQSISSASLGIYLSTDSIFDSNDKYIQSFYAYDLYPNNLINTNTNAYIPSGTPDGVYYLIVIADYYNNIIETNENNNIKYEKITVDNFPVIAPNPELALKNCYIEETDIPSGAQIIFKGMATNEGSSVSDVELAFYLSADSILDIADLKNRLFEYNYYSLNQGTISNITRSFNLPQNIDTGYYYIIAKIDDYNTVFENDEKNNIAPVSIHVSEPTIDLRIESMSLNTSLILKGKPVNISFTIGNEGSSIAPSSDVIVYLATNSKDTGGIQLYKNTVSSINPSNSSYFSFSITIPDSIDDGVYYLMAKADYLNKIEETNENNNLTARVVGIMKPDIDFRIDNINITNTTIIPGSTLNFNYNFYNEGSTNSIETKVGYYLSSDTIFDENSDELIGYYNVSSLSRNSHINIYGYPQIPGNLSIGTYRLFLVSDYLKNVQEKSEDNNISFVDFVIYPAFLDLKVENLTIDKNILASGEQVYLSCNIRNIGNSNAGSSYVGYYLSNDTLLDANDILMGSDYTYSLYSNDYSYEYQYLTIPENMDTGKYYIITMADYQKVINESNEINNIAYKKINVIYSDVDLLMTNLSVTNTNLPSGSYTYVNYTLINNGTTECSTSDTKFYISLDTILNPLEDTYLGYYSNSRISGGNSRTINAYVSIASTIKTGTYYLFAVADMLNTVSETNESNNSMRILVNITETFVDLVITDASVQGNNLYPGDYTTLYYYIRNLGNKESSSSYSRFYLSNDTVYDSNDLYISEQYNSYVSSNSHRNYSTGINLPYGSMNNQCYILIIADYNNNNNEKNENNNVKAIPITFNPVWNTDLKSGWDTHNGYYYSPGDTLKCTFFFSYSGLDSISPFSIGYYLSTDEFQDITDYFFYQTEIIGPFTDTIIETNAVLILPDTLEAGNYKVLGVIDPFNFIQEVDENNNTQAFNIELTQLPEYFNEESFSGTNFYPNPVTNYFHLLNKNNYQYIKIFNSSGIQIMNCKLYKDLNTIDVSNLLPGNYTVQLIGNQRTEQLRFVKVKN